MTDFKQERRKIKPYRTKPMKLYVFGFLGKFVTMSSIKLMILDLTGLLIGGVAVVGVCCA